MRRILFLIANLEGGGAEKVLLTIVNRMCADYDITVQTIYDEGLYRDELDSRVHYQSIVRRPNLNKKRIMHRLITYLPSEWIYKWFVRCEYDVSIAFLEGISSKLVSGASKNTKTIAWIHADIRNIKPKHAGFVGSKDQQKCYNRYSKIVCVSQNAKQAFVDTVQPLVEPVAINNPIDSETIITLASAGYEGEEKERFTFCSVGRLVEVKALERIIYALAKLKKDGISCAVWIIGEGASSEELKRLAENLHVGEYIKFLGFMRNPYPVMKRCDAFICSSKYEGYSLAVAEALVLGLPVIATNTIGPREILENGKYGLLVDNSAQGVYSGMKAVLESSELLSELQNKAAMRGRSFDILHIMEKIKALVDSV